MLFKEGKYYILDRKEACIYVFNANGTFLRNSKSKQGDGPGEYHCIVDFDISNIGRRAGAALAQVYVADKYPRVQKPAKELKAFEKIYLEPGETREITMILEGDAFTYYDETSHGFKADAGSYMLLLAKNADEVVDITEIEFNCTSYRIS